MKKLAIFIFSAFIVTNLMACSNSPNQSGEQTKKGPVTLKTWDLNGGNDALAQWQTKRQKDFETANPNIKFERTAIPQQAATGGVSGDRIAFTTAMASGTAPDIYHAGHFPTMQVWIRQGFAYPLDEYIKDWADNKKLVPALIKSAQYEGKTYGIPNYVYVMNFAYRKDMYKAAGLDPEKGPATWEEMIENGKKISKDDKKQYGLGLVTGGGFPDWYFQFYVWQAGGELSSQNPDGTVNIYLNSPEVKKAGQLYYDLRWKHNILQSDMTAGLTNMQDDFTQGRCAQTLYMGYWYANWKNKGLKDETLGIAPMPVGPSGKPVASNGGAYYFINPKSSKEKRDAAWEYIKYIAGEEAVKDKFIFFKANGVNAPEVSAYSTVNPSDYMAIPKQWSDAIKVATENSREEYVLVDRIRPLLAKVIEKILVDKKSDVNKLFDDVQKQVQAEVIDPYNKEIKSKK